MPAPACYFRSAYFLINLGTLLANGDRQSVVTLNRRHEFDPAVAVPMVMPIEICHNRLARDIPAGE